MRNSATLQQVLFIPKDCQQPRSRGSARPRRHPPLPGSMFDSPSCKYGSSSPSTASVDGLCVRASERSTVEGASVDTSMDSCKSGDSGGHKNDHSSTDSDTGPLRHTPIKSTSLSTETYNDWVAPGSVVWAKTDSQMWWPAEVIDEREIQSNASDQSSDGHVLVQLLQTDRYCWVDPVESLSRFDNCFEKRSCNLKEEFQDALKQALLKVEQMSSCQHLYESSDIEKSSIKKVPTSYEANDSCSTGTEDNCDARGRGKRKRKPKVHFDDVHVPVKSIKKGRRLKIMRLLGLTPPLGSPFSLTSHLRTAYK
ncbi:hypothetical protein H6P81_017777 [Aristolochia fimbriata]|uniref:PWWP domain-containing protein n=1 Tax=Aristolochia fimbriata TaxID=158543 RepID=A0AAV7DZK3_ARIFI|nr:hypothetical protein H6P81_017777 [Aristolochia fimbriata]